MAQVTFNIKDTRIVETEDAVAALNGYQATFISEDGAETPNPETKTQFMRKWLKAQLRNQVIEHRNRQALATTAAQDSEL